MRTFVFQLSGQLIIEEQAIIQPGFGVLRGEGADQRIDPAALFPRFRQIGQQAMLLLLEQLNGQTVASGSRLLDSELIIRGSTAAPKR